MKRILVALTVLALWFGHANAQDFSVRAGLQLLLIPGVHIAGAVDFGGWGVEARVSGFSILLVSQIQFDIYAFYSITANWQLYAGVGWGRISAIFDSNTYYVKAILGISLVSGIFFELNPLYTSFNTCLAADGSTQSGFEGGCPPTTQRGYAVGYGFLFTLGFSWRL